ncbi:hypothetical protein [Streptomyces sp. JJ38]|uniref:hypothetical protein n=1 Tax=Streptomyces sp. JJ38 TaxID=2738128 RepID=UPI001C57DA0B|nr:hypothetical protein [Streptomyces sp. JJ38]MBW1599004.1 hypothetical protein [Streptomyces sp. JJ38]
MLRPKYPATFTPADLDTTAIAPTAIHPAHTSPDPACTCQHTNTAPGAAPALGQSSSPVLRSGALVAAGAGGVLVVGTVLVSLLLAVAVTATSVAVCALVLRSMTRPRHYRR